MYPSPHDKQWKTRLASVGRRDRIKTNDEGSVNLFLVPKNPKAKSQDGSKPILALLKETER